MKTIHQGFSKPIYSSSYALGFERIPADTAGKYYNKVLI